MTVEVALISLLAIAALVVLFLGLAQALEGRAPLPSRQAEPLPTRRTVPQWATPLHTDPPAPAPSERTLVTEPAPAERLLTTEPALLTTEPAPSEPMLTTEPSPVTGSPRPSPFARRPGPPPSGAASSAAGGSPPTAALRAPGESLGAPSARGVDDSGPADAAQEAGWPTSPRISLTEALRRTGAAADPAASGVPFGATSTALMEPAPRDATDSRARDTAHAAAEQIEQLPSLGTEVRTPALEREVADDPADAARAARASAVDEQVSARLRAGEWAEARRLLDEAAGRGELDERQALALDRAVASALKRAVERLVSPAIRGARDEPRAVRALDEARALLDSLPADVVSASDRAALGRRIAWAHARLGIQRVRAGRAEGGLESLGHALSQRGLGPERLRRVRETMVEALEALASQAETASNEIGADDRAKDLARELADHIARVRSLGVPARLLGPVVERAFRLTPTPPLDPDA